MATSSKIERRDASNESVGKDEGVVTMSRAFNVYDKVDGIETDSVDENKGETLQVESVEQ